MGEAGSASIEPVRIQGLNRRAKTSHQASQGRIHGSISSARFSGYCLIVIISGAGKYSNQLRNNQRFVTFFERVRKARLRRAHEYARKVSVLVRIPWAEKTKAEELPQAMEWLKGLAEKNLIDWDVLTYPATVMLKSTNGEKNILHVPVQRVYMLESLGISPAASSLEVAKALYGVMQIVRYASQEQGQGEVYFLCKDEQTQKFAEHNGFERLNIPVFRMKV